MRENQFLGILALILALGMPLPYELFACVIFAAEGKVFDAEVHTESDLISALKDPDILQITLNNEIVTTQTLEISRNLILDLGGFNITSLKSDACIDIKYGAVMITGQGGLVAYGSQGIAIRVKGATTSDNENYAEVLIDHEVKLFAPNQYGLFVAPNFNAAYGVIVDFHGTVVAQNGFCISDKICGRGKNIPVIKIGDHAKITVDENSGVAIHAVGYGRWEIGAAEITGASGVVAHSGNITLNGTEIISTGEYVEDDLAITGAVFQSAEMSHSNHTAEMTINSGEYTSLHSYIFVDTRPENSKPALQMLIIEDGEFAGKLGTFQGFAPRNTDQAVAVVYGGHFTENVQDYISSSCHIKKASGQGIYQVIEDKVTEEHDEAARLARAEGQLEALIEQSLSYIDDYVIDDIGKWKPIATKAIASIKRAITLGKKALKQQLEYKNIVSAERSLQRALDNFTLVGDTMRAELAEAVASVNAIAPHDYTQYSYQQLVAVTTVAEDLLQQDDVSLQDLYSALLDVEINIDLLDVADELIDKSVEDSPGEPTDEFADEFTDKPIEAASEENTNELIEDVVDESIEYISDDSIKDISDESIDESIADILDKFADAPVVKGTPDEPMNEPIEEFVSEPVEDADELIASLFLSQAELLLTSSSTIEDEPIAVVDESSITKDKSPIIEDAPILTEDESNLIENTPLATENEPILIEDNSILAESEPPIVEDELPFVPEPTTSPDIDAAYILSHGVDYPAEAALLEAKGNLYSMLEAVQDLSLVDYETEYAEQFGELQVAIVKARTILYKSDSTFVELMSIMDELTQKTTGIKNFTEIPEVTEEHFSLPDDMANSHFGILPNIDDSYPDIVLNTINQSTPNPTSDMFDQLTSNTALNTADQPTMSVAPNTTNQPDPVDWAGLFEVVSKISHLRVSDFTEQSYARVISQLEIAQSMLASANATQSAIEDLVFELNLALLALEHVTPPAVEQATTIESTISEPITSTVTTIPTAELTPSAPTANTTTTSKPAAIYTPLTIEQDQTVTPNLAMSMLAGAYAGLATYRRSRLLAKQQKSSVL